MGWRATKFGESFIESVENIFPSTIINFSLENDLASLLKMLLVSEEEEWHC